MPRCPARLLLICGSVAFCRPGAAAPEKPNILIVLVDDQGCGNLSGHGNPPTPHMDRLYANARPVHDGVVALRNGAMNVSLGRLPLRSCAKPGCPRTRLSFS